MQRCTRCILPDTIPNITFNKDGVCNFCSSYKTVQYYGESKLLEQLDLITGKGSHYDCIVPISGGKDSAYVLYMAAKRYGLKTLAVNFDNGYQEQSARTNMTNACNRLNVDFIQISSQKKHAKKYVKDFLRSNIDSNDILSQSMCYACRYGVRAAAFSICEKYQIPLILWGHAPHELTVDMEFKAYDNGENCLDKKSKNKVAKYIDKQYDGGRYLHKKIDVNFNNEKLYKAFLSAIDGRRPLSAHKLFNPYLYRSEYHKFLMRLELPVPNNTFLSRSFTTLKNPNTKQIKFFQYMEWNRETIMRTVINELDWAYPSENRAAWRFDCSLHSIMNYQFYQLFGCSKDAFGFTNLINSDQIKRDECLSQENDFISEIDFVKTQLLYDCTSQRVV